MNNRNKRAAAKYALIAAGFSALCVSGYSAFAADSSHPVYMLGGNEFIIRKMPAGHGQVYLYAYRRAGNQWEHHSIATVDPGSKFRGNSIPERIYRRGTYLGRVSVDLDNPLNTDLNLYPGR